MLLAARGEWKLKEKKKKTYKRTSEILKKLKGIEGKKRTIYKR